MEVVGLYYNYTLVNYNFCNFAINYNFCNFAINSILTLCTSKEINATKKKQKKQGNSGCLSDNHKVESLD